MNNQISETVENTEGSNEANTEAETSSMKSHLLSTPPKLTFPLAIGVFAAVTGYSFQYGYNVAVINAPAQMLREFNFSRDNIYAIAVSSFAIAGMIGSLLVGLTISQFGRLGGLMAINVFSVIAAVLMALSKSFHSYPMLVIGRGFVGLFAGLGSGLVPIYIGETSPKAWRGIVGVFLQLQIAVGVLVAQILGLNSILGSAKLWPYLLSFTCLMSIIAWICYPFMQKSPRSLLIDKRNESEAIKVLQKLRGVNDVTTEIDEMKIEAAAQAAEGQMNLYEFVRERSVRFQMITVALLMLSQNCSGINAIFFYSNSIFRQAGIPDGIQQDLASISIGAIFAIMVVITAFIIERFGRRPLLQIGFGTMAIWCLLMAIVMYLSNGTYKDVKWISYLSIGCLVGYMISFAIGPGPIPWILSAELFRQAARPPALVVTCLFNWGGNVLVGQTFPAVAALTGPWVFIGFMLCSALTALYVTLVLPETKGKTFQEISFLFAKINKTKISVERKNADKKKTRVRSGSSKSSIRVKPFTVVTKKEARNISLIVHSVKSPLIPAKTQLSEGVLNESVKNEGDDTNNLPQEASASQNLF